ncbi:cytochrome P450 [Cladochytrium replicatum]|nr:cytochrome P450 [Cladochytrium replicatum]
MTMFASTIAVLATVAVSVLTILGVVLLLFDTTKPKRRAPDGKILNLPPSVPWTFILPRIGNVRQLLVDIKRYYGDLSYIHFPFRGSMLLALGNDAAHWFHRELKDFLSPTSLWDPKFPETMEPSDVIRLIVRSLNQEFYKRVHSSLIVLLRTRVEEWADRCDKGETFDVFQEAHNMVLDVNTKVMFGDDWDEKELAEFKESFVFSDPAHYFGDPLNILFPSRGSEIRQKWNKILFDASLRQAQKHLDNGPKPAESSVDFFLGQGLRPTKAAILSCTMELSSYTTTGSAASWLLYHLADSEDIRKRARAELEAVIPAGEGLSIEQLPKLHFIDSIVREIIRVHLVGVGLRKASDELQYKSMDIPKDSAIVFMHSSTHHESDIFENPFEFKPDRFLDYNKEFNGMDYVRESKLLAFGAGKHPCVGMRLATTELKIMTYELLMNYDLKLTNEPVLPPLPGMGFEVPKNSVRFTVSRRKRE